MKKNCMMAVLIMCAFGISGCMTKKYVVYQEDSATISEQPQQKSVNTILPQPMPKVDEKKIEEPRVGPPNPSFKQEVEQLIKIGYKPDIPDGYITSKTREAVKVFQKDNNLEVTGRLDPPTAIKLEQLSSLH